MRVAGVLTSRGYNIESLTVAKTLDPTLSSMTILADVQGGDRPLLIKQITRLVNVIKAVDLTESQSVQRELALIKVSSVKPEMRSSLAKEAEIFRARIVDVSPSHYTLEVTGSPDKIDALIGLLHNYGDVEMTRCGVCHNPGFFEFRFIQVVNEPGVDRKREGGIVIITKGRGGLQGPDAA